MFRSKYAKAETETFVELTFSYQRKEYKIRRNPEYQTQKKRGTGFTTKKQMRSSFIPRTSDCYENGGSDKGGNGTYGS